MHPTLTSLLAAGPVITDGAWGTQLQLRGLAPGDCPDEWNLTHPDLVRDVARLYAGSGSRVILTNTFRSNRIALAGHGLADRVAGINSAGVRLSREGAGAGVAVFASVGPSGKMLLSGEVTVEELEAAFREQCTALASANPDAIVVETMGDLEEAVIAVKASKATGLPVVASMVFDSGKEHDRTMMGSTPEQAAAALEEAGADVIGANCGLGIEGYVRVASRLRAATTLPVWIKANAGLPEMVEGQIVYKTTPEEFARHAEALRDIQFVGGCCGTTPDFIRALAARRSR